jgi:3-hydroxy-9,10-secoandrosta-1,3,5(10)-triene-9,17-dione monooxygenase reductase component
MSQPEIDSRALRDALSSFATGVTIVTTADATGEPIGMTASSFNSVSMDPPLILWSVTKTALSAPIFEKAEHFSVHVLAADQMTLSNRFARSGADKFDGVDYKLDDKGVPQLAGVLTRFDCKTWSVYEGGDHWIIVGEVQNMETQKGEGLVFSGGSYATASSIQPPNPDSQADDGPIEELLIYNLARAYVQVSRRFHASVEETGLTIAQWRILASLHGNKSRSVADLVARTFVSPKKMNHLLNQMQEAGWLTVSGHNSEAIVSSTAKGQAQVEHLFELGAQQEAEALGKAGKSGQDRLIGLLRQVIDNTND